MGGGGGAPARALGVRENARGERGGFVPWDLGKRARRVGGGREEEEAAFARASERAIETGVNVASKIEPYLFRGGMQKKKKQRTHA